MSAATPRYASTLHDSRLSAVQVFRFSTSKSSSLFLQRKNPRKIAWTVVYRRMHKKVS
jgi:ribosomal protein L24E